MNVDHRAYALKCIEQLHDPHTLLSTKQMLVQIALVHAILDVSSKLDKE
jgi:hypothetical protein